MSAALDEAYTPRAVNYDSRFIDNRGNIRWLALEAESRTAFRVARILCADESPIWDRSTDAEINAELTRHGIDLADVSTWYADVITVAKRARLLRDRAEKFQSERWRR